MSASLASLAMGKLQVLLCHGSAVPGVWAEHYLQNDSCYHFESDALSHFKASLCILQWVDISSKPGTKLLNVLGCNSLSGASGQKSFWVGVGVDVCLPSVSPIRHASQFQKAYFNYEANNTS